MKPLSDQISRGQSFVHAVTQKTAREQFGPATDRRLFGDFNKTFLRPLKHPCDWQCFWSQSDRSQSQAMCDRGLSQDIKSYDYQRSRLLFDLCPRSLIIFCSKAARPTEARSHVELLWVVRMKV